MSTNNLKASKPTTKSKTAGSRAKRAPASTGTKEHGMNTGNETFAENTQRMIEHGNKNAEAMIEAPNYPPI